MPCFSQVAAEARKLGSPKVEIFKFDIGKVASIRSAFEAIAKVFPAIDISVVNSGVFTAGSLDSFTEEAYDNLFNVNTKGAFFTAQETAKLIRDGGRIVFISSVVSHEKLPGSTVYAATKGALNQFSRLLAVELGPRKITVNSVSPGFTETDMLPDGLREIATNASPFKRIGKVDDIASAVDFLVSDAGAWVSGTDLNVSGAASIY